MNEFDFKSFFSCFKKNLLIFISMVILGASSGIIYFTFFDKPIYKSSATVILSGDEKITQNEVTLNKNLTETYAEVAKSRLVLNQVKDELQLSEEYSSIANKVSVSTLTNTQILKISVSDESASRAKDIANSVSKYFINTVSDLYKIENIHVLDEAVEPTSSSNISFIKLEMIFIIIGVVAGFGIVFLIFYFDNSIKSSEQVAKITNYPVLGSIHKIKKMDRGELVTEFNPKSVIAEDLRTIRTNMQFTMSEKDSKTILVSSSFPGEGKSFISANLGVAFAKTGKKCLLIDCDMRLGRLHEIFKVSNKFGLSTILSEHKIKNYADYVQDTMVSNLSLIPRGTIPPNPNELLGLESMDRLIRDLKQQYDFIILDGTPVQGLADSLVLSRNADRTVIVCNGEKSTTNSLAETKNAFSKLNVKVAGVVLNEVRGSGSKYYDNYYYSNANKTSK